jgi:hypothetical protein
MPAQWKWGHYAHEIIVMILSAKPSASSLGARLKRLIYLLVAFHCQF